MTRRILRLAHVAATVALAWAVIEAWRELHVLRDWSLRQATETERIRERIKAMEAHDATIPEFPPCGRVFCGHRAAAHGEQSGHPGPDEPCHAAVDGKGTECRCVGYAMPKVAARRTGRR